MADYYPLVARAVAGLEKNTGEARRALYERARTALVAQLRGINPPLQEAEITRERLALEEAVRKVEAEAARRSRIDTTIPQQPPAAPQQPPAVPPPPPPAPSAPRFPNAAPAAPGTSLPPKAPPRPGVPLQAPRPPVGPGHPPAGAPIPGLPPKAAPPRAAPPGPPLSRPPGAPRPSAFDAAKSPPSAPPPGAPRPPRDPFAELAASHGFDRMEPSIAQEDFNREPRGPPGRDDTLVQPMDPFRESPRGRAQRDADEEEPEEPRKPRSMGGLIRAAIAVALVLGLGLLAYSQRGLITDLFQAFTTPSTQVARDSKTGAQQKDQQGRPKITDRLGTGQQAGPAVAQRVVLYEEEPNDPQGKRYIGSAIWRTETVSPGPGRPPELAIRADVEIPERRMTMTLSIRRNTDQTLPASHTIEVTFNLPADFPAGGIQNVPGVLMKQAEQTRGTPLAGLAVKVTNNFFLIGLSAVESDQQRNIQLLKERAWFDIPVVYNNNRRAILAIEKGTPGERAFAEAFAAWKQ
jgi:hypothetical protein